MSKTKLPNNSGFKIRFMYKGVPYCRTTGKGATPAQADELERQMREDAIAESLGFFTDKTIDEAITKWFLEYVYPYKGSKGLVRPNTYESHANYVLQFTEDRLLTEVVEVAKEIKEAMEEHGYKKSYIKQKMNILKRPTNLAYEEWNWLQHPIAGNRDAKGKFPKIGEGEPDYRFLTRDEVDLLVECCANAIAKELLYFLAYTGLRWAEFKRLNAGSLRKDLRTKENILLVEGKGYKDRVIPLHEEQVDFVINYVPFQPTYRFIRHHLNKAKALAGLDITPHGLRHSYGTMLAEDGVEPREIMQLMGHTTLKMSIIYTQLSVGHLRTKIPKQRARPSGENIVRMRPALRVIQ